MSEMRARDGTILQSGLTRRPEDYDHERLWWPVVGIVMAVQFSDDPQNRSAVPVSDQRGSYCTCTVLVVNDGSNNMWTIPNVIVLPPDPSGIDDYAEAIPRPCSQMIDASQYRVDLAGIDCTKLDGDWCVVQFVGGSIEQPIMTSWWPHPSNRQDPATFGWPILGANGQLTSTGNLSQGRRYFRRYAGLKQTVTSDGSYYIDTNESGYFFQGSSSGPQRKAKDEGGDVQIDVKPSRHFEINFNKPIPLPAVPSLPQPNPPGPAQTRATDRTTLTLDKDTLHALAGKVIELLTSDDYIEVHAKTKVRLHGDDSSDTVLLGDTDPANCDHAIKAETFRDSFYNMFIEAFKNHKHGTPVGPTSPPTPDPNPAGPIPPQALGASAITNYVKVKK